MENVLYAPRVGAKEKKDIWRSTVTMYRRGRTARKTAEKETEMAKWRNGEIEMQKARKTNV